MQAPEDQGKPALPWANTSTEPDTDAKAEQVLNADESTATAAEPPPSKRPKTDSKENLEPQPVAKAAPARHFKTGEYIEVLWQLEEDGVGQAKWWKAKVLGPSPKSDSASAAAPYVIRYEKYQDIAEEEAEVIVLAQDQLRHADKEDVMKWRHAGDTSVPTESEFEEGRDDTVTLHELNEDGEDLERDIGASIEDAVMKHLQENLPMDGQQRVMAGFRNFADFIKQRLAQKQADKGSEHVVTSEDVAEMLNAFRQSN